MQRRGLEPDFRVLFSTIFHGIAHGNCQQVRKRRILVEAKLLQVYVHFYLGFKSFVLLTRPRKRQYKRVFEHAPFICGNFIAESPSRLDLKCERPAREEIRSRESVQAVESFRLLPGAPSGVAGALACSSSSPGAGTG